MLYVKTVADVPVLIYLDIILDLSGSIWIHLGTDENIRKNPRNVDSVSAAVYLLKPVKTY
jgi:hypothetical protein